MPKSKSMVQSVVIIFQSVIFLIYFIYKPNINWKMINFWYIYCLCMVQFWGDLVTPSLPLWYRDASLLVRYVWALLFFQS